MPNIMKKDINKMNQDLESPLNEEDEGDDDLSDENMSEKSNESDRSQKEDRETKKK
jgi:hypothetical protein